MADVNFATVRVELPTTIGAYVDATRSGFGTPVAAMVFMTSARAATNPAVNTLLGVGFSDFTNAVSFTAETQDDTAQSSLRMSSDTLFLDADTESVNLTVSAIENGVRITRATKTNSTAYYVVVVLIGGTDVTGAKAGYITLGSDTTPVSTTAPNFRPDLVFLGGVGYAGHAATAQAAGVFHFGIAHDDGSATQSGISWGDVDGQNPSTIYIKESTSTIGGQLYGASVTWEGTLAFDTLGFTLTPSAAPGSDVVYYLALQFSGSPDVKVFSETGPSSTGTFTSTAAGFTPTFGMYLLADTSTQNAVETAGSSMGVAVFDSTSQFCTTTLSQDNKANPSATQSTTNTGIVDYTGAKAALHTGTFTEFTASGWSWSFSTAPGTARKWIGLAIGEGSASTPTMTLDIAHV